MPLLKEISFANLTETPQLKDISFENLLQPEGITPTGIESFPVPVSERFEQLQIGPAPERGFFETGRVPLPPDADRIEKLKRGFDIIVGTPLRVGLKFAKGITFNVPDLMWAGIKKITPDSIWDSDVKKMTLDQAMDWAAGADPSGFELLVGDIAEFAGRLKTARLIGIKTGILAKDLPKGTTILNRAFETAKLFGLGETGRQLQRLMSEMIDPETDYQYQGGKSVLVDMGLGAGLSLGNSLIVKPALAKTAQTRVGKAIIENYDRAMIEISKRFPIMADTIRRNPSEEISKLVNKQFEVRGIDPKQFTLEQKAVANHIGRELEKRFARAFKNFKPPEDIIKAKVRPKLIPGEIRPVVTPIKPPTAPPVAKVPVEAIKVPLKVVKPVKEGIRVFHGTVAESAKDIKEKGVRLGDIKGTGFGNIIGFSVSKSAEFAKEFASETGDVVLEFIISPEAKIATAENMPEGITKGMFNIEEQEKAIQLAKDKGFDAVDIESFFAKSTGRPDIEQEIQIINPDILELVTQPPTVKVEKVISAAEEQIMAKKAALFSLGEVPIPEAEAKQNVFVIMRDAIETQLAEIPRDMGVASPEFAKWIRGPVKEAVYKELQEKGIPEKFIQEAWDEFNKPLTEIAKPIPTVKAVEAVEVTKNVIKEGVNFVNVNYNVTSKDGFDIGRAVAFVDKDKNVVTLTGFIVKEGYRRKGIGTAIINKIKQDFPDMVINTKGVRTKEGEAFFRKVLDEAKPVPTVKVRGIFDPKNPPTAKGRSISAIKMDDGTILFDTEALIHSDMIESLNIKPEEIDEGGFIVEGKYVSGAADVPRIALQAKAKKRVEEKRAVKLQEVVITKPSEITKIPKAPKTPITPTIELKGKEAQIFNEAVRTQEIITAAESGEVGLEPAGASFTDHIDTFQSYQLPSTSKIPQITKQMKKINGLRLAGKITPTAANKRIHRLRQLLIRQAIKEKIALRINKKGKVKIALRESGVFVPEEVATYTKYKDIEPILGGGQDITRAIQQMDGSLTIREKLKIKGQAGPIERFVLWRTRKMTLQKLNWLKEKTIEIKNILSAKKGSKKDKDINIILEQIGKANRDAPIKDVLSKETLASMSKETIQSAQELRQFYDDLIEEQNAARLMRGQDEIPYRQNYSPHILRDTTVWEQVFLREKTAKILEGKDLPDYIKPNVPFNPRAQAREGDIPYDKRVLSARELAESYIITASKDIFNTSIIQNNKAFIDQLKGQGLEKSAEYLAEWTATSFAGIKPRLDRAIKLPKWAQGSLRYFNRLRNMAVFPFNVAWSLSTQPLSLSNTIGRYGLPNTVRGFFQWMKPSIRKQAAQDYFSFIVKSTRRGGVTKQDAANLLGENIKTTKSIGEFVENFSTILLTEMEKLLTGMSIRAAHIQGHKKGLRGEALKQFASDGGGKTQSMYNDEDKPMILRSLLVKSGAPYQTYAFEIANTFREWAGKTGTPPDTKLYAMWSVTRWLASLIVLRMMANAVRGKKWSWWDLLPIPFREFWLSPIVRKLTGEYLPGSSGLPAPVETATKVAKGINDVLEENNWRKLRNVTLTYGPGVIKVPGGVQWSRMVDAIISYSNGGVHDRRGRLLFEMNEPEDLARGLFTGVWSTKRGREKLKGKKKQTFDEPID